MKKSLLICALALSACATTPQARQRGVYAIESDYRAALAAAVAYRRLPPCGGVVRICASGNILAQFRDANHKALAALKAAESAVRAAPDQPSTQQLIVQASQLVAQFAALVAGAAK